MVDLLKKKVRHTGTLGVGTVIAQNEGSITVEFAGRISKFMYPSAFEKFLIPEEAEILNALKAEIAAMKDEEKITKTEEITQYVIGEQARLEKLKVRATDLSKQSISSKDYVSVIRKQGQALTYLVFQGTTFEEECKGQFIWAPKYTKSGGTCHHWDRLLDIRKGDVILHCSDGYIRAISRAKGPCEDSARPDKASGDWTQWEKDGRRVDCDYYLLKAPLKHGAYKDIILQYCNVKYAPFDKSGNGNMGYLFDLNPLLAGFFVKEIAKHNMEVIYLDYLKFLLV